MLGKVSWAAPSCHLNEQTDVSTAVRLFSISRNFLSFGGAGRFLGGWLFAVLVWGFLVFGCWFFVVLCVVFVALFSQAVPKSPVA